MTETKHNCPLCRATIAGDYLMCGKHWKLVPFPLRTRVLGLFRTEAGSDTHKRACAEAVLFVAGVLRPQPPRTA